MKNLIVIAPYDPHWPLEFQHLGTPLCEALGDLALRIDHIGSTAVPGLSAKDVIDVQITVATLDARTRLRNGANCTSAHLRASGAPIPMSARRVGPINATPYSSAITCAPIQVSAEPMLRSRKRSPVSTPRTSTATMT